jgi:hypothetical protein
MAKGAPATPATGPLGLRLKGAAWAFALAAVLSAALLKQWPTIYATLERLETSPMPPRKGQMPKPDHCRPDLPGCVPLQIDNIFFLHIPKVSRDG